MRNSSINNYETIALIGNNSYEIKFMSYLFESQGIKSIYEKIFEPNDLDKDKAIKKIAYYFGLHGSILVDNNGLIQLLEKYSIKQDINTHELSSEEIINQINFCLQSDAVYVCNSCGKVNKYISFILGYLMSKKQEIFFWNDIDESEWLMSSITKNNKNWQKEMIPFL